MLHQLEDCTYELLVSYTQSHDQNYISVRSRSSTNLRSLRGGEKMHWQAEIGIRGRPFSFFFLSLFFQVLLFQRTKKCDKTFSFFLGTGCTSSSGKNSFCQIYYIRMHREISYLLISRYQGVQCVSLVIPLVSFFWNKS